MIKISVIITKSVYLKTAKTIPKKILLWFRQVTGQTLNNFKTSGQEGFQTGPLPQMRMILCILEP